MRVNIKPLSVNQVWQGRRFKTPKYKDYEKEFLLILPNMSVGTGKLSLFLRFGFSNKGSDIDNPIKPVLDILQKRYGFNDSQIYRLEVEKDIVKKGSEYIDITIETSH